MWNIRLLSKTESERGTINYTIERLENKELGDTLYNYSFNINFSNLLIFRSRYWNHAIYVEFFYIVQSFFKYNFIKLEQYVKDYFSEIYLFFNIVDFKFLFNYLLIWSAFQ